MADIDEEQLLSDLLSGVARDAAHHDAAHLEARVIAAAFAQPAESKAGVARMRYFVAAAAVVVGTIAVPAILPTELGETRRSAGDAAKVVRTDAAVRSPTAAATAQSNRPAQHTNLRTNLTTQTNPTPPTNPTYPTKPMGPTNPTHPTNPSLAEFVPLMPMTEQELTGPFQLVRVQMPRASLGALRSALESPTDLIEADVLLGEDGMARAIRVSASGSVYPWRSR